MSEISNVDVWKELTNVFSSQLQTFKCIQERFSCLLPGIGLVPVIIEALRRYKLCISWKIHIAGNKKKCTGIVSSAENRIQILNICFFYYMHSISMFYQAHAFPLHFPLRSKNVLADRWWARWIISETHWIYFTCSRPSFGAGLQPGNDRR